MSLGFTKPSVSVAMKNLRENGYAKTDEDGMITLTDKGRKIAETIYDRQHFFVRLLAALGVEASTAGEVRAG